MPSYIGSYPMTDAIRERMLRRLEARAGRGMWHSWLADQFYCYEGWREFLEELVESGRVERRQVANGKINGGYKTSVLYVSRKTEHGDPIARSARNGTARDHG